MESTALMDASQAATVTVLTTVTTPRSIDVTTATQMEQYKRTITSRSQIQKQLKKHWKHERVKQFHSWLASSAPASIATRDSSHDLKQTDDGDSEKT